MQQVVGDDRLGHVQLQLARLRRHGDRHVVADDLVADLADELGDDRVDLARHDRRARLHRRQVDLVQPAARARRRASAGRCRSSRPARRPASSSRPSARTRRSPAWLRRGSAAFFSGSPVASARRLRDQVGVARRAVDARADRGGAHVDLVQLLDRPRRAPPSRCRSSPRRRRTPGRASSARRPGSPCGPSSATWANSFSLAASAARSSPIAASVSLSEKITASLIAVG